MSSSAVGSIPWAEAKLRRLQEIWIALDELDHSRSIATAYQDAFALSELENDATSPAHPLIHRLREQVDRIQHDPYERQVVDLAREEANIIHALTVHGPPAALQNVARGREAFLRLIHMRGQSRTRYMSPLWEEKDEKALGRSRGQGRGMSERKRRMYFAVGPIYDRFERINKIWPIAQTYHDLHGYFRLKLMGKKISPALEKLVEELRRDHVKGEVVTLIHDITTHGSALARDVLKKARNQFLMEVIDAPRSARELGRGQQRREEMTDRKRAMYFGGL
ncbi:hypothetical protein JCM8547_005329 [Rhodosporidiobolus lusitaniae]